jgi:hypothetical protein
VRSHVLTLRSHRVDDKFTAGQLMTDGIRTAAVLTLYGPEADFRGCLVSGVRHLEECGLKKGIILGKRANFCDVTSAIRLRRVEYVSELPPTWQDN